jgi:hypothetical protein
MTPDLSQSISPSPSPFAGGLRGLPLSTPVTSLLPRPRNAPGVYSKAPPVPLPFSGGGDREGGPSFQCPLPSSLVDILYNNNNLMYIDTRGISILGEVRNVAISRATQQLLCSKFHDFLAVFSLAHSKINQIA